MMWSSFLILLHIMLFFKTVIFVTWQLTIRWELIRCTIFKEMAEGANKGTQYMEDIPYGSKEHLLEDWWLGSAVGKVEAALRMWADDWKSKWLGSHGDRHKSNPEREVCSALGEAAEAVVEHRNAIETWATADPEWLVVVMLSCRQRKIPNSFCLWAIDFALLSGLWMAYSNSNYILSQMLHVKRNLRWPCLKWPLSASD